MHRAGLDPFIVRRLGFALLFALAACQVDEPHLSQTQQLAVVLSPSSLSFGSLQIGQTSAYQSIDVNPGLAENDDLIVSITESCPDFILSTPGLPGTPQHVYRTCYYDNCPDPYDPNCNIKVQPIICQTLDSQSYTFSAAFKPTVAGSVSCVVTVTLDSGLTRTATLSGTGTVPPKDIDVTPTSIPFGDVRRNTDSTAVNVTVKNVGGVAMTVSSATIASSHYTLTGTQTSYSLAAGASRQYTIACSPTVTGSVNSSFVVQSDDPITPTVTVPLTCRGIDSNLALTPSPTTLTTTRVGEPVQANIALQNSGLASINLQSVSVSGTDITLMSAPAPGTYPQGSLGNAVVRFGAAEAGAQDGTLTITYDGGMTRTSAISARALATSMALTPDGDVSFGPVCAGQSKTEQFSILANDEGSFQVTQLGGTVAPFTVAMPTLPANVAGSGASTVTFDVTASPTVEGTQTSELQLATNIPNSAPRTINLTVDALPAGVSPSPPTLEFGSTLPMTTTIGQKVNLSNCSLTPAAFSNPRIEGANASEFAIVLQPSGTMIDANGTVEWLVVMTASVPGLKSAEFVVDYEGGTARVPLTGEGLGADVGGEEPGAIDEVSYYSCSATGATGSRAWPLVLVLGIVLRRRRRR